MKVALVHDYLREYGGAERVLEVMHEMWPQAPVYTSFVDWDALGNHRERFTSWDIRPSWVQNNWIVKRFHSPLRFLAPKVWGSFDLSHYDAVISSSGWYMCRGVALHQKVTAKNQNQNSTPPLHICYIHHPPRNLYGYATGRTLQKYWPVRLYATVINFFLRHYDYTTAQAVNFFVANSKETAKRVKKFYRRESVVIYPPVDVPSQTKKGVSEKKYYLSVGRLVYSKQIDSIIQACNDLQLPLKIVGTGKEEVYLKSIAGPTIEFVGEVSDEELHVLYGGAKAVVFAAIDEDFGLVPVEAMGHGVPVIALSQGGVRETVLPQKTGVWFDTLTPEAIKKAVGEFQKMNKDWSVACRKQADRFSKQRFKKEFREFVEDKYFQYTTHTP